MRIRRILRPRSWLALVALCGVACAILFLATASTQAKKAACGPARAHTVVADRSARVYRVVAGDFLGRTVYVYYGCTGGHGKPELLASTKQINRAEVRIKLSGVAVGVDVLDIGTDTEGHTLTVRDLTNGRVPTRSAPIGWSVTGTV